jgi:hypothetical protein
VSQIRRCIACETQPVGYAHVRASRLRHGGSDPHMDVLVLSSLVRFVCHAFILPPAEFSVLRATRPKQWKAKSQTGRIYLLLLRIPKFTVTELFGGSQRSTTRPGRSPL